MNFYIRNITIALSIIAAQVHTTDIGSVSQTINGITVTARIIPTNEIVQHFGQKIPDLFCRWYSRIFPIALTIENNTDTKIRSIQHCLSDQKTYRTVLWLEYFEALTSCGYQRALYNDMTGDLIAYRQMREMIKRFAKGQTSIKPNQLLKTYVFLLAEPNLEYEETAEYQANESFVTRYLLPSGCFYRHPKHFNLILYFENETFELQLQVPN